MASTGTDVHEQARQQAISIYAAVNARVEQGLAVQSRTFDQIAFQEIEAMNKKAKLKQAIQIRVLAKTQRGSK